MVQTRRKRRQVGDRVECRGLTFEAARHTAAQMSAERMNEAGETTYWSFVLAPDANNENRDGRYDFTPDGMFTLDPDHEFDQRARENGGAA